jgi:hypothetical protein
MLLCRTGHCPANQAKPGLLPFYAASLAHARRFSKKPLCPAIAHKATIVLPDFIRSCSTDGKGRLT